MQENFKIGLEAHLLCKASDCLRAQDEKMQIPIVGLVSNGESKLTGRHGSIGHRFRDRSAQVAVIE